MKHEGGVRNFVLSLCDLKQLGDVPPQLVAAQMLTFGLRVFLFGGADEGQISNDLYILELEKFTWRICSSPSNGRYGHSLTDLGDDSFVSFGGFGVDNEEDSERGFPPPPFVWPCTQPRLWKHRGQPTCDLWQFKTSTLQWKCLSHEDFDDSTNVGSPPSLAFHSAVSIPTSDENDIANYLIIYGGTEDSSFKTISSSLHVYDLKEGEWLINLNQIGDIPSPRYGHKMVFVKNQKAVYLFGGDFEDSALYQLDCNDLITNGASSPLTFKWTKIALSNRSNCAPLGRRFHSMDVVSNRLYVYGGITAAMTTSDMYVYDFDENKWIRPIHDGEICLSAHAAAVLHDKLLVYGGSRPPITELQFALLQQGAARHRQRMSGIGAAGLAGGGGGVGLGEGPSRLSRKLFFASILEVKHSDSGVGSKTMKFKIVTVGDSGVGKSCLLQRFVQDIYTKNHDVTIGVDFFTAVAMIRGKLVHLQLWDTAGQERFSSLTGNYYRNAHGFILVFDATRKDTFRHIEKWVSHIHEACGEENVAKMVFLLIGNKQDLKDQIQVSDQEGKQLADRLKAVFLKTSALTGAGVDTAFLLAATQLVETKVAEERNNSQGGGGANTQQQQQHHLSLDQAHSTSGVFGLVEACRVC